MNISFEDTRTAFRYKTAKELRRARFLFKIMEKPWLVELGLWFIPIAIRIGLPIKWLIRRTLFTQFVGGETLKDTAKMVGRLRQFNVYTILDYGIEGKESEESFGRAAAEFTRVITYAASQPNIPFISLKVTALARSGLLQKIESISGYTDIINGEVSLGALSDDEKAEWKRVVTRLYKIVEKAASNDIGLLIDAEESWIQDAIDVIAIQMMKQFNRHKAIVYNTAQLYRKDRFQFIKDCSSRAKENNFICAMKLVRGAYMDKERKRAVKFNYDSPINETKQDTDNEYNAALEFCINPVNDLYIVIGSHNEYSNLYATELMKKFGLSFNDPRIHFSQLFGMSDHITFNLAKAGCYVSKYLPFGPVKDVIPYLLRRAQENSSVDEQSGRELALIRKELNRRLLSE
jgi:proline dehydrogenase